MSEFASEWMDHQGIYHTFRAWRERLGRYRLLGSKCKNCGYLWFPARHGACGKCNSRDLEDYECAHEGVVAEFFIKDNPFNDLAGTELYGRQKRTPALVRLDDGVFVWSEVNDCPITDVKVGMRVKLVLRKWLRESNTNWQYGYKFVPA